MKFAIKHEIKGRMRIHVAQYRMSCAQADTLLYFLQNDIQGSSAKVYERTGDAVICYDGSRAELIDKLRHFHYEDVEVPNGLIENSGRELNASYQEKLIGRVVGRYASRIFLPYPIRACWTTVKLHLEGHKDTGGTKDRSTGTRCDGDRSVYSAR